MVKCSSTYIVIILSLLIALSSMAFLILAYRYRLERLQYTRQRTLNEGFTSACSVLLSNNFYADGDLKRLRLFEDREDSCELLKGMWGIYQYATVKYAVSSDTLKRSFLMGVQSMSDSSALYLCDEDRPVSLSGSTLIRGDVEAPRAGLRRSYVDGASFHGETLVHGRTLNSGKALPELSATMLERIRQYFRQEPGSDYLKGSLNVSFFQSAKTVTVPRSQARLDEFNLKGKIILRSDTVLSLGKGLELEDVIVCAKSIIVEPGFRGHCQLFAQDSIVCKAESILEYPSVLGLLHEKPDEQGVIRLYAGSRVDGNIFAWQEPKSQVRNVIAVAKDAQVSGDVYSSGLISLEKGSRIQGKMWCNRILMQIRGVIYENYLVDVSLDRLARSKHFLLGMLFTKTGANGILRWVD